MILMPVHADEGQRLGVEQLVEIASVGDGVEVLSTGAVPGLPGWVQVEVSLDCSGTPYASEGLRLRGRERFLIAIAPGFPFHHPEVRVPHTRWAGVPHVQFGEWLCLYAAPSIEWAPADGMRGLVERLTLWLDRASMGQLDPDDQPLHPPVAYAAPTAGVVVVRADLGELAPQPRPPHRQAGGERRPRGGDAPHDCRLLVAICEQHDAARLDVVGWVGREAWRRRAVEGAVAAGRDGRPLVGALAVLMDTEISFEYPRQVSDLLRGLEGAGVPVGELITAMAEVAAINCIVAATGTISSPALRVLVGSPSRTRAGGAVLQHLVCWRADDVAKAVSESLSPDLAERPHLDLPARMEGAIQDSLGDDGELAWEHVLDARPEVTVRRDIGSAAQWLARRRILVLGCGALGAPIAGHCLRAGAAVTLVDKDIVTPGILVRQPYSDAEIGMAKAAALAHRLDRIRRDQPVAFIIGTVQQTVLADGTPPPFDLVIDATADASVASLIELQRSRARSAWPAVMSVIIGHDARRGVVTISRPGATGCGGDVLRRLALAGRGQHAARLHDVAEDILRAEPRADLFQPEPGCSQPTFTGSSAELGALAGMLLDTGLRALGGLGGVDDPMAAAVVRLDAPGGPDHRLPGVDWFGWSDDVVTVDGATGHEVRISQAAMSGMRAECRRGARLRGSDVETGGLLIGRIDDACRCVWIDDACGPPPDSRLSAFHLDHGIEGVGELIRHHRERSAGESTYVGMWHTHPMGQAEPSPTDTAASHELVASSVGGPPRALLLILGGEERRWTAWLGKGEVPCVHAELVHRRSLGDRPQAPATPAGHDRTWLPGGWATARPQSPERQRRGPLAWLLRRLGGRP